MYHRTKRLATVVAAGLALGLVLAGCSASSTGSDPNAKVTLTFANADPSTTWAAVIKGFEAKNPNITVKQLNIPYAQFTSTITQRFSQGAKNLDLFVVDTGQLQDTWKRGYLADLSDLQSKAEAAAVSPDMVKANVVDGKLGAIETWTTSQFLYYNKDLLAKAGIDAPSADPASPWTYEQMTAAAQKVKDASAAQYPFVWDQYDSYYQLQPLGVSAGGGYGIVNGKADFSNAGWQKALKWYGGLFTDGLSPRGITNDKTEALFQSGKAAFMIAGPWALAGNAKAKVNFGVAANPYFEGGKPATSTDSWSVGISSKTPNLAASKKFLEYMTLDPVGNYESSQVVNIPPTQKDAFAKYVKLSEGTSGDNGTNFGAIFDYQLKANSVHRPDVIGYTVFEPEANKMFSDIRNGTDPAARAKQADDTIDAQLARLK